MWSKGTRHQRSHTMWFCLPEPYILGKSVDIEIRPYIESTSTDHRSWRADKWRLGLLGGRGKWLSMRFGLQKSLFKQTERQLNMLWSIGEAAIEKRTWAATLESGFQQVSQSQKHGAILKRRGDTWLPQLNQWAKKQIWYTGVFFQYHSPWEWCQCL